MNRKDALKRRHLRDKERGKRLAEINRRKTYFAELRKIKINSLSDAETIYNAAVLGDSVCFICENSLTPEDYDTYKVMGFRAVVCYFAHRTHFYTETGEPLPDFDRSIKMAAAVIRAAEVKRRTGMTIKSD